LKTQPDKDHICRCPFILFAQKE